MINWQPMHTAPRDDRLVLIYDENATKHPFKLAKYHEGCGWHCKGSGFILWPKYWANVDYPEPFFRVKLRRRLKK